MARTASGAASSLAKHFLPDETIGQPHDLLSALFQSSAVGVAICDRQLRFRAVNDALASMNGIPRLHILVRLYMLFLEALPRKFNPPSSTYSPPDSCY